MHNIDHNALSDAQGLRLLGVPPSKSAALASCHPDHSSGCAPELSQEYDRFEVGHIDAIVDLLPTFSSCISRLHTINRTVTIARIRMHFHS